MKKYLKGFLKIDSFLGPDFRVSRIFILHFCLTSLRELWYVSGLDPTINKHHGYDLWRKGYTLKSPPFPCSLPAGIFQTIEQETRSFNSNGSIVVLGIKQIRHALYPWATSPAWWHWSWRVLKIEIIFWHGTWDLGDRLLGRREL